MFLTQAVCKTDWNIRYNLMTSIPRSCFFLCSEVLDWERLLKLKDLFLMNSTGKLFNQSYWCSCSKMLVTVTVYPFPHQCDFPGTPCYKMMLEGSVSCRFVCSPPVGVTGALCQLVSLRAWAAGPWPPQQLAGRQFSCCFAWSLVCRRRGLVLLRTGVGIVKCGIDFLSSRWCLGKSKTLHIL